MSIEREAVEDEEAERRGSWNREEQREVDKIRKWMKKDVERIVAQLTEQERLSNDEDKGRRRLVGELAKAMDRLRREWKELQEDAALEVAVRKVQEQPAEEQAMGMENSALGSAERESIREAKLNPRESGELWRHWVDGRDRIRREEQEGRAVREDVERFVRAAWEGKDVVGAWWWCARSEHPFVRERPDRPEEIPAGHQPRAQRSLQNLGEKPDLEVPHQFSRFVQPLRENTQPPHQVDALRNRCDVH